MRDKKPVISKIEMAFEWERFVLGRRRLSFSGFNVLMGTPNPEKDNLQRCTVYRYRHRRRGKKLFTVPGNFENFTGKNSVNSWEL